MEIQIADLMSYMQCPSLFLYRHYGERYNINPKVSDLYCKSLYVTVLWYHNKRMHESCSWIVLVNYWEKTFSTITDGVHASPEYSSLLAKGITFLRWHFEASQKYETIFVGYPYYISIETKDGYTVELQGSIDLVLKHKEKEEVYLVTVAKETYGGSDKKGNNVLSLIHREGFRSTGFASSYERCHEQILSLQKGTVIQVDRGTRDWSSAKVHILDAVRAIKHDIFYVRQCSHCRSCAYNRNCNLKTSNKLRQKWKNKSKN